MTDIREIVAKAMDGAWRTNDLFDENVFAAAALQAIEQAGCAIVPVETILKLCDEAEEYDVYSTLPADTRAMLTAAKEKQ